MAQLIVAGPLGKFDLSDQERLDPTARSQIETDAEAGKLDQLAEEALRDFREGKCIRLP